MDSFGKCEGEHKLTYTRTHTHTHGTIETYVIFVCYDITHKNNKWNIFLNIRNSFKYTDILIKQKQTGYYFERSLAFVQSK